MNFFRIKVGWEVIIGGDKIQFGWDDNNNAFVSKNGKELGVRESFELLLKRKFTPSPCFFSDSNKQYESNTNGIVNFLMDKCNHEGLKVRKLINREVNKDSYFSYDELLYQIPDNEVMKLALSYGFNPDTLCSFGGVAQFIVEKQRERFGLDDILDNIVIEYNVHYSNGEYCRTFSNKNEALEKALGVGGFVRKIIVADLFT